MVCIFSHWAKASPCKQATPSSLDKIQLEIIPTRGTPVEPYSDQETYFTGS